MIESHNQYLKSLRGILLAFLLLGCASPVVAQKWTYIVPPVDDAPAVVEFFSFYCPPCYAFSQTMKVDSAIRQILPEGEQMVKYHVSQLGPMGPLLTRAWALAMVIKKTEPVEKEFFTARMVQKSLNSPEDIRRVFIAATGISAEEYDQKIKSPEVDELVLLQERLFKEYGIKGTPSVNVRGQYHINNSAFSVFTVDDFRKYYASVILQLLTNDKAPD